MYLNVQNPQKASHRDLAKKLQVSFHRLCRQARMSCTYRVDVVQKGDVGPRAVSFAQVRLNISLTGVSTWSMDVSTW